MKLNVADKKIIRLKNFESSLLELRHSIRNIKYEFRKNITQESCDTLKETYKKKLKEYTIKEIDYLLSMINRY